MSSADGFIFSSIKLLDHGDNSQRFNIVFMSDGFQAGDLPKFHTAVDNVVNGLKATPPFNDLWCAINVHRIDVVSTDSGVDDPATCGDGATGSGTMRNSYFDGSFCGGGQVRRGISCDTNLAYNTAATALGVSVVQVPIVLVNSTEYGGQASGPFGRRVGCFSLSSELVDVCIHEMGHVGFQLADEYEYLKGCGSGESGHDSFMGGEPSEPNVTKNTNSSTIKWAALLTDTAALPTTNNPDCSKCDPQGNPKAASYVGAYEGADTMHCGVFRPSFDCKMRNKSTAFCAVCQQAIRAVLTPFLPDADPILLTPSITFSNIPEGVGGVGVTTFRAIVFELDACMAASRHLHITSGPTGGFTTPLGTTAELVTVGGGAVAQARLWIGYTSTTAGATATGSVTVHCDETGQDYPVSITANTVARPKTAVALVLDHSFSMHEDAGDGTSKTDKLREAANIFLSAMQTGDGVSVTRFDDTSQILMGVTDVGPPTIGAGRIAASGHLGTEIDPAGDTSIGAGVVNGKATLDTAQASGTPHYDNLSMVVLTDGVENTPPMLIDVRSSLTSNTFAIGLGKPENISVAALSALTQAHNGYLLVTGAITPDQAARLSKYFLQILAGATNADIILDPHGQLTVGAEHRIPFWVSEADIGLDVFLLSPTPYLVDFQLETPDGSRITPASVGVGNIAFVPGGRSTYYRLALPALPLAAAGSHGGRWYAVLRLGKGRYTYAAGAASSVNYDLTVHCHSNLNFGARGVQTGYEVGASTTLSATLKEYDVPVSGRANVWAEVTRPDGFALTLAMPQVEAGRFEASFLCGISGLYTCRVRAQGTTLYGSAFQREQALTAAVYPGGGNQDGTGGPRDDGSGDSHPGGRPGDGNPGGDGRHPGGRNPAAGPCDCTDPFWCQLIRCLMSGAVFSPHLLAVMKERGFNLEALLRCLSAHCQKSGQAQGTGLSPEAVKRIADAIANELR